MNRITVLPLPAFRSEEMVTSGDICFYEAGKLVETSLRKVGGGGGGPRTGTDA